MKSEYPVFDFSKLKEVTNDIYYPHYWNTDRHFATYGSGGSGKSHFCAEKIINRLVNEDVGHRFLILRKYSPSIMESAFKLVKDYLVKWELYEFCKITVKPMQIVFLPNGNEIYFRGLDDLEKIKSIEGVTGIWYEEATEASYNDILQLDTRLRPKFKNIKFIDEEGIERKRKATVEDGAYPQIMYSYNPISKQKWTYKEHYRDSPKSYRKQVKTKVNYLGKEQIVISWMTVLHTTYKDNRFLTLQYVASLEAKINQSLTHYKIYALGEYADLKHKIYSNYKVENSFAEQEFEKVWYGLDFGYTHPMAMIKVCKNQEHRYLREVFYESGYDTKQFIEWLDDNNFSKTALIYADSAEPDRIQQIADAGYNIRPAYKAAGSVLGGIDYCQRLQVHILGYDENLVREFIMYKYAEDRDGNIIFDNNGNEKVAKLDDDLMDAWRYAEYTEFIEGGKVPSCRSIG